MCVACRMLACVTYNGSMCARRAAWHGALACSQAGEDTPYSLGDGLPGWQVVSLGHSLLLIIAVVPALAHAHRCAHSARHGCRGNSSSSSHSTRHQPQGQQQQQQGNSGSGNTAGDTAAAVVVAGGTSRRALAAGAGGQHARPSLRMEDHDGPSLRNGQQAAHASVCFVLCGLFKLLVSTIWAEGNAGWTAQFPRAQQVVLMGKQ